MTAPARSSRHCQPPALGVAALAALMGPETAILPAYLLVVAATFAVSLLLPTAAVAAWTLRVLGSAALAAAAVTHGVIWAHTGTDLVAWGTSAAILLSALALVARRRN